MKTKLLLIAIVAFCFNVNAQLSGDYTLGTSDSDYPTIASAVSDAVTSGVNGPVTFKIKAGLYEEGTIVIDSIPGASKTNYITFTSEDENADSVIIKNEDEDVIQLVDAAWIHIENLTIECSGEDKNGLTASGSCHGFNVTNNKFKLEHNDAYGIYRYEKNENGKVAGDTIIITNNTFTGGYSAIYLYNENSFYSHYVLIDNNEISNIGRYGIYVHDFGYVYDEQGEKTTSGGAKITRNKISSKVTQSTDGIRVAFVNDELEVSSNEVILFGDYAINGLYQSNNKGTENKHQRWFNNFVYVASTNGNTIALTVQNGNYNEFSNNTFVVDKSIGDGGVVKYSFAGIHKYYNNVFLNKGCLLLPI